MLSKDNCLLLGSLFKANGIKGEVILRFLNNISEKIKKMESVFIEIDGKLVPFFIENFKEKSINSAVVKLELVDNELQASEFIGCNFYILGDPNSSIDNNENDYESVIGYTLKDQDMKDIGKIVEYIEIPGNPLLRVQTEKTELLIPAHDDLIVEIDDDQKYVSIQITEGLLEIDD